MNKQNERMLRTKMDYDKIQEIRKQLIQTFESLPDQAAIEVLDELKGRDII